MKKVKSSSKTSSFKGNKDKAGNPDKVSFTSIKRGENQYGSPTVVAYLGNDAIAVLVRRLSAVSEKSDKGAKLFIQIIEGDKYDSGYAYVDEKQEGQFGRDKGFKAKRKEASDQGKEKAKKFLNKKKVEKDGDEEE